MNVRIRLLACLAWFVAAISPAAAGAAGEILTMDGQTVTVLRDRYGERLATWQGEPIEGIEDELGALWDPYHLPPPPVS